ncbi:MAG: TetR/AcrR family transcriptional regulator [Ruminococcaceae bacterium]|nr:TetR/AcrR family transcriptional regulator [Oscillospiraceae bacterium]
MDRRQRKTREAIFHAFTELLSRTDYHNITVGEIIEKADIGRATFYAHFETKDYLLKAFCEELFCHLFDTQFNTNHEHRHIFDCGSTESVFLHLFRHLQKNDHNILTLLACRNNSLFLSYFRSSLEGLIEDNLSLFNAKKSDQVPEAFWKNHILSTFMGTLEWWLNHGRKESPEVITQYFFNVI